MIDKIFTVEQFTCDEEGLRELLKEISAVTDFLQKLLAEIKECNRDPDKELDASFDNYSLLDLSKLHNLDCDLWSHIVKIQTGEEDYDEAYSELYSIYRKLSNAKSLFRYQEQERALNSVHEMHDEQRKLLDAANAEEEEQQE